MKTLHETRTARAARVVATRIETEGEVFLTIPHESKNVVRLDRIIAYMRRFCGDYCVYSSTAWNYLIVKKRG